MRFGVPFYQDSCTNYGKAECIEYVSSRCSRNEKVCFRTAMARLVTMKPIDTVYLDFDKTMAVNDYSKIVRNSLCQQGYPSKPMSPNQACTSFNAEDTMVGLSGLT